MASVANALAMGEEEVSATAARLTYTDERQVSLAKKIFNFAHISFETVKVSEGEESRT